MPKRSRNKGWAGPLTEEQMAAMPRTPLPDRLPTDSELRAQIAADPDSPPLLTAAQLRAGVVVPAKRPRKEPISLRIDADVLASLRAKPGWQTRVNAILRAAMTREQELERAPQLQEFVRTVAASAAKLGLHEFFRR